MRAAAKILKTQKKIHERRAKLLKRMSFDLIKKTS